MAAELKPCPFCGGAMHVRTNRDWHRLVGDHAEDCLIQDFEPYCAATSQDREALVAGWNRRATDGVRGPDAAEVDQGVANVYAAMGWKKDDTPAGVTTSAGVREELMVAREQAGRLSSTYGPQLIAIRKVRDALDKALSLIAASNGVSLPLPPSKDRIETLWQQWSVAGQVMYRQGFENALGNAGVKTCGEAHAHEPCNEACAELGMHPKYCPRTCGRRPPAAGVTSAVGYQSRDGFASEADAKGASGVEVRDAD